RCPAYDIDDREHAALSGGARRDKVSECDHHEGKRVERSKQTIVQFGAESVRLLNIGPIIGIGEYQLPQVALTDRIVDCLGTASKLRKVKSVAVEDYHRRVAFFSLLTLQDSILKNQKRSVVAFQQLADLGNYGDTFVWIAPVVEKNSEQLAII